MGKGYDKKIINFSHLNKSHYILLQIDALESHTYSFYLHNLKILKGKINMVQQYFNYSPGSINTLVTKLTCNLLA